MSSSGNVRRGASGLLATATDAFAARRWGFSPVDPAELRYPATILVWVRWSLLLAGVMLIVYRPEFDHLQYPFHIPLTIAAGGLTGYLHTTSGPVG